MSLMNKNNLKSESKNILICAAWPYANGDLHLGHVAGAYLPADIFARYHRLSGNKVLMVSGSDSHGTPITLKAKEEKCTPLEVVKRYHHRFLEGWKSLGISFDLFTHTHTENHCEITKQVFKKLKSQDDLKVATQQQFFDTTEQMFLPDRYVRGTCPFCKNERARGDQCEACGKTFDSTALINPISTLSNTTPEIRDTDHYFFHLEHYQEQVAQYVSEQKHWRSHVQNFTSSMIEDGLKPRPITRDIDWGVEVPETGWEKKVIYVWFDAVIGYYSASVEWAKTFSAADSWKDWWKNKEAKTYYFIGKDNIPFHTVIWPVELMAYDPELNLPYDVPANQFLNIEGEKFSTSRGLAVWLLEMLERFDADALRFYLTTIMPETKDANFSLDEMYTRNNGELVAAWGNLVNRVLGFAYSRYDQRVPIPQELDQRDLGLLAEIEKGIEVVGEYYNKVCLRDGLKEALRLTREVNRYLDEKAPWTAYKESKEKAGTSIYVAMKAIDSLKIIFAPILPNSSQKIHEIFGYTEPLFGEQEILEQKETSDSYEILNYKKNKSETEFVNRWKPSDLQPGTLFAKPEPLFKVLEQDK
jgi:methionyl-tRNA synthetase